MEEKSDVEIRRDTGLTLAQFDDLCNSLPSLLGTFSTKVLARESLYMFLMKMRTAKPLEDIAIPYKVSTATVCVRLRKIRKILCEDFVPINLTLMRNREDLTSHTTTMCKTIFAPDSSRVILICDGTYIYVDKSTNYEFQRNTYTDQKKRNFLKFMMVVASDGTIVHALGPFKAKDNDATILKNIHESTDAFRNLHKGDLLILDRGFRDCVSYFKKHGFDVQMPSLLQNSNKKNQLSTIEANKTRLITATRFVVETMNGHLKTIWKIFNSTWNPKTLVHLKDDLTICAALINKYFHTFEPNKNIAADIAQRMVDRVNLKNELSEIINSKLFQKNYSNLRPFADVESLPKVSELDLIYIALGKYQIKQAASYHHEHTKSNNGASEVFSLPDEICGSIFQRFQMDGRSLLLLMMRMKSRFRNQKRHDAFILIDRNSQPETVVLGYCCSCYCGLRTVGCCSHVMCLIWYSLFVQNRRIAPPAGFLDNYLDAAAEDENDESD